MDFTSQISQIQRTSSATTNLLKRYRLLACFGNRALLNFFLSGLTRPGQVAGAATTEEEGLALLTRHRPDFLVVTDQLEQGCGIRLVERTKASYPEVRTLLLVGHLQRPAKLRAAIQAGCDGLCLESGMGLLGLQNSEIAARLYLSPETVKSHLHNLRNKLGARDRNHAAFLALRLGLVDWPQEG